jgi:beta-lactamase class A
MQARHIFLVATVLIAFALGAGAEYLYTTRWSKNLNRESNNAERQGQNFYINPLLDCPGHPEDPPPKVAELEEEVTTLLEREHKAGHLQSSAVYYRDLNNGPTFGIDEDILFTGASLLKVPVMIACFKKMEEEPGFGRQTLKFDPAKHVIQGVTQNIQPQDSLVPGQSYSIENLIEHTIRFSDNSAAKMVLSQLSIEVATVFKEMGIQVRDVDGEVMVSVKSYASLFRILYNSTYLNRKYSSRALELLGNTQFNAGLPAGVPAEIPVSHKYGERKLGELKQFHDCGIVYAPTRPYLLCVMTRGRDFNELIRVVADVSKTVYTQVTNP